MRRLVILDRYKKIQTETYQCDILQCDFDFKIDTNTLPSIEDVDVDIQNIFYNGRPYSASGRSFSELILSLGHEQVIVSLSYTRRGEALSGLIAHRLFNAGVVGLFRAITIDENLIGFGNFLRASEIERIMRDAWYNFYFTKDYQPLSEGHGYSLKEACLLEKLRFHPPSSVRNINQEGTSTITYLTKRLLDEH